MSYTKNTVKKIEPFLIAFIIGSLFLIESQNIKIVLMCILGGFYIIKTSILSYIEKRLNNILELILGMSLIILSITQKMNYLIYIIIIIIFFLTIEFIKKVKPKNKIIR